MDKRTESELVTSALLARLAISVCETPVKTERGLGGRVDHCKGPSVAATPDKFALPMTWFQQPPFIQVDLASITLSSQIELTHQISTFEITVLI
jgi:hypothetical protein